MTVQVGCGSGYARVWPQPSSAHPPPPSAHPLPLLSLETFSIHQMVAGMGSRDELVVRIVPRLVDAAETWAGRTLETSGVPGQVEIFERFTKPLLGQIRIDASRQIVNLAEMRLGINGPITSVRQAARKASLTRARVYQLLNEINDIMNVRWPQASGRLEICPTAQRNRHVGRPYLP